MAIRSITTVRESAAGCADECRKCIRKWHAFARVRDSVHQPNHIDDVEKELRTASSLALQRAYLEIAHSLQRDGNEYARQTVQELGLNDLELEALIDELEKTAQTIADLTTLSS